MADGDALRVHNDRGAVELRVRVGEHMRPGGTSVNALTADGLSDLGAAETSTIPWWR